MLQNYITLVNDVYGEMNLYLSRIDEYQGSHSGMTSKFTYVGDDFVKKFYVDLSPAETTLYWTFKKDPGKKIRIDYNTNNGYFIVTWYNNGIELGNSGFNGYQLSVPYGVAYFATAPNSNYIIMCRSSYTINDPPKNGDMVNVNTQYGSLTLEIDKWGNYSNFVDEGEVFPGQESGTGGGTGNFDNTGDDIDIPSLPTLTAVNTGFITLFNPTLAELKNLSSYMWSDVFDPATFRKLFANPMDAILGLSIVPVSVPESGTAEVKVGNISTGISMLMTTTQFVEVDCGSINLSEYWGSFLDYDPYTKIELYLPYIGTHPISVDDVMGKTIQIKYHVDIISGACCAYVKCGNSVLYSFVGQCSISIPITSGDWTNVINGVLNISGAIGTMVATGGATAPMAVGQIASTAVNTMKPSIEKSGSISGVGGMLGIQKPYIILTRPRQALPKNMNTFTGYPSFVTTKLSDLTGYTEIDSIHLENIDATESELNEIENLLKSGVIF